MVFLAILKNMNGEADWAHPSELNAVSKSAAITMLLQNTDKQYIQGVYTVDEFNQIYRQAFR